MFQYWSLIALIDPPIDGGKLLHYVSRFKRKHKPRLQRVLGCVLDDLEGEGLLKGTRRAREPGVAPTDATAEPRDDDKPVASGLPERAELPWDKTRDGFVTGTEAKRLSDGKLTLSSLSKLCHANGSIHYMRQKGVGLRVYLPDLREYLKTIHPGDAFDSLDEYVEGVGGRREEVDERKRLGN